MALVKKNSLGEMGVHFYELNGVVEAIECSVAEYDALGLPGAGAPSLPEGAKWLHSIKRPKFDTQDGTLGEGQYGSDGNGTAWVRPVGGVEVLAKEEDIINDEPNNKALDDMGKQSKLMERKGAPLIEIKKWR